MESPATTGSGRPGIQYLQDAGAVRMSQEWDAQSRLSHSGVGRPAPRLFRASPFRRTEPEFASSHDAFGLEGLRGGRLGERRISCAWTLTRAL